MKTGIYKISAPSGNYYIGSAAYFARRWGTHLWHLRKGTHHSPPLQAAFNKYGEGGWAEYGGQETFTRNY